MPTISTRETNRVRSIEWYEANKDRAKARQRRWMQDKRLRERGLTRADYDAMLVAQHGVCAICRTPPPPERVLVVDHDHDTGEIRGLLCSPCNRGIGNLRDDPGLVYAALRYLEGGR